MTGHQSQSSEIPNSSKILIFESGGIALRKHLSPFFMRKHTHFFVLFRKLSCSTRSNRFYSTIGYESLWGKFPYTEFPPSTSPYTNTSMYSARIRVTINVMLTEN